MLVDSHAHLEAVENLEAELGLSETAGVSKIISIGTDLKSSKLAANLALSCSKPGLEIWATAGIHPADGKADIETLGIEKCIEALERIAKGSEKVIGIGETGLDYFEESDKQRATSNMEKSYQKELFSSQLKLAAGLKLPVVIHCRNAWKDIFEILRFAQNDIKGKDRLRGVFHSFTGGIQEAKKAVEIGFYVSFSGIVTFKNAKNIKEAANWLPIDKMLVETDSPYLTPEPIRGQKNSPKNVKITFDFLAELKGIRQTDLYARIAQNTHALFAI